MKEFFKKIFDTICGFFEWIGDLWNTDDLFKGIYLVVGALFIISGAVRRK